MDSVTPTGTPAAAPAGSPSPSGGGGPTESTTAKDMFASEPTPGSQAQPAVQPTTPTAQPAGVPPPALPSTPPTGAPQSPPATPPVGAPPAGTAPAPVPLDRQTIESIVQGAVRGVQPPAQPPPFDQAKFERDFQVAKVTPDDMKILSEGGEKAVAHMQDMLQRPAKQALTMANFLIQQSLQQFRQELAPYMEFANASRETMFRQEFLGQNADLKDYEPIVHEVINKLQAAGVRGTKEEIFKKVSDEARRLIQVATKGNVPPTSGTPPPTGGQQPSQPTSPRMTPLSGGGQGGAGQGPASSDGSGNKTARTLFS